MLALSNSTTVTISVAGVVLGIALIVLVRSLINREPRPNGWRRIRLGFFIEREGKNDKNPPVA